MTATPDQSLCSSSQKSAREVIGQITEWLPLVQFEEEIAMSTCSPPPATRLYYVNNTAKVSAKQTMSVSRLQQWRMEDQKKPNVLEEFVGNTEEKMFQSLLSEMEDQEKSYLGIRKNPSSRQQARAQCGVMRAAATHTTSQAKHTRAVLLCRVQTTDCSSPGSERGPARDPRTRKISKKTSDKILKKIIKSGLGSSRHQDLGAWTSRQSRLW